MVLNLKIDHKQNSQKFFNLVRNFFKFLKSQEFLQLYTVNLLIKEPSQFYQLKTVSNIVFLNVLKFPREQEIPPKKFQIFLDPLAGPNPDFIGYLKMALWSWSLYSLNRGCCATWVETLWAS